MLLSSTLGLASQAIRLHVNLTDAPRNIYHARLQIPVHAGNVALVFPKWIPGNHRPSGPIGGLMGIRMEAAGHSVPWQRDAVEMYEFHVTVPAGVAVLEVSLDAMDLIADSDADLAMNPEDVAAYEKLVAETGALFGARHYHQYHFLLTLSDQVGGHGLEHHESNDSVAAERTLLDPDLHMLYA